MLMVKNNTQQMTIRSDQLPNNRSLSNQSYLATAMLLGTPNCNYLGQRLNTHLRDQIADNELIVNATMKSSPTPMPLQMHSALSQTKIESPEPDADTHKDDMKMRHFNTASTFTIDSILAPKPTIDMRLEYNTTKSDSRSPSNSPSLSSASSPMRPARVPAMLHPGLQLPHLAAVAASGFGTPSDFFGMSRCIFFSPVYYFVVVLLTLDSNTLNVVKI